MKPRLPLLVALLVAAALLALRWTGRHRAAVLPELRGAPQAAARDAAPATRPESSESPESAPVRVLVERESAPSRADGGGRDEASLRLSFRSAHDGRAVPDVAFHLYYGGPNGPLAGRADARGAATAVVPAGGSVLVWVDGTTRHGYAEHEVAALAPGGERRVEIALATGRDRDWYGRVEWQGAPVPARVTVLEYGEGDEPSVLDERTTDARGQVVVRVPSWRPVDVRVVAPGRGVALVAAEAGHESPAAAQLVPLRPSGALRAHVEDAAGAPLEGVRVVLEVGAWELTPSPSVAAHADELVVEGVTGADGVASLEDVPAEVGLDVRLFAAGRPVHREERAAPVPARERVERRFRLGASGRVHVRVLDERGRPVAGARVGLVPDPWRSGAGRQFTAPPPTDAALTTTTDVRGTATVEEVPLGAWSVACTPPEDASRTLVCLAPPVALTADAPEADVTLTLRPGLAISGRVVDGEGRGVPGQRVFAFGTTFGGNVTAWSQEDGSFRLRPVVPGTWSLGVETNDGWVAPPYRELPAGRDSVEVVLTRGSFVQGVVRDATGAPSDAQIVAFALDGDRPNAAVAREFARGGEFSLEGLAAGRHALVATSEDGRIALADDVVVEPPGTANLVELVLAPAVPIRLRYSGPAETCTVLVTQRGVTLAYVLLPRGVTESFFAPAGLLDVRVEPEGEPPTSLARLVEPGPAVELVVE